MGMRRVYTCNICGDELDNPADSFGVRFGDGKEFTLVGYGCTDGTHICYGCAKILKKELNKITEV